MAILKIKKLIEDIEHNTTLVLSSSVETLVGEMSVAYATTAGNAGTAYKATSAGNAGTSRVAHFGSSGTANIAGTSAVWSTGGL